MLHQKLTKNALYNTLIMHQKKTDFSNSSHTHDSCNTHSCLFLCIALLTHTHTHESEGGAEPSDTINYPCTLAISPIRHCPSPTNTSNSPELCPLSDTRWESHIDSIKAIRFHVTAV